MDPLILSRMQFGANISFHILFPTITIALGWVLLFFKLRYNATNDSAWMRAYFTWVKVFALSFAMGVVSGVTMSFQFGTNWPGYMEKVGNIAGPLLAYEILTAFFLEAAFLGIMLFGWEKVGDRLHFFATCMVALGTLLSAFWILSANSWMQTPAGHAIENGIAVPVDWWRVVFNPSFPNRFAHMVMAAYLTTAFAVAGMSAWMILRARQEPPEKVAGARLSLSMAMWFAAVFAPVQIVLGDLHGLNVLAHQPTKLAAIEANWETRAGAPLVLFAWPDATAEENKCELAIPKLGSYILTHELGGVVPGLKNVPPNERPPVWPVFWSFRIMVAIGFAMLGLGLWSLWLRWKGALFDNRWFLRATMVMTPSGFGAVLFGWFTAEIGRQPYVVYGLLRTADAVSPVARGAVAGSLATFVVVYAFVFGFGSYYLAKLLRKGPEPIEEAMRGEDFSGRVDKKAKRPLSVPNESLAGGPGRRTQPAE
jgi:cytochrome bd ubiquinol oxidase subunit I